MAAQQAGQYIAAVDRRTLTVERKLGAISLASEVVTEVDICRFQKKVS